MSIAATLKDAREIVLLSQKSKTVVAVNENWAYHPLVCAVAEYVKNGGIGEVKTKTRRKYQEKVLIYPLYRSLTSPTILLVHIAPTLLIMLLNGAKTLNILGK